MRNPSRTRGYIFPVIKCFIITMIDIGYVQGSRPQSLAEELTKPNSRVKEAEIADHP